MIGFKVFRSKESRALGSGFLFVAIITTGTILAGLARSNRAGAVEVCTLLRENYFRAHEPRNDAILSKCLLEAQSESWTFSRAQEIARINRRLSAIRTSHLSVFSPVENRALWLNEGLGTGIRARRIDGEIVVYELLPASPADRAGVRPGDAIVSVNGEATDTDEVESRSGRYRIARGPQLLELALRAEELSADLSPELRTLDEGVGLLRLQSFLAHYFDDEEWRELVAELRDSRSLVIDLRGNSGGSFPAMLRALSPFLCRPTIIGSLWTSRALKDASAGESPSPMAMTVAVAMANDLRPSAQIEAMAESPILNLKTFENYGCFDGPVTALVDGGTSSVAEIFAHAISMRPRSRVWGEPTAGQVVMARWFSIASFGGGDFAISIPIAGFRTANGEELERIGLEPARILAYDLKSALRGEDSWLRDAKDVSK